MDIILEVFVWGSGWYKRMNQEEEDWIYNLIISCKKRHKIEFSMCADSFGNYYYDIHNSNWTNNPMEMLDWPPDPFPDND